MEDHERGSASAVDEIGLDEPLDAGGSANDGGDPNPRWLWVLVGDGGVNGQKVYVRYFADDAPHGVPTFRATPYGPSTKVVTVTETGLVANDSASPPLAADQRTDRKRRQRHRSLVGSGPVPADAFVDQWSDLVPHDVYLRLAAEKRFPSTRHGHSILARWGDVRAALRRLAEETPALNDPLNEIRATLGLLPKGGR